MTLDRNSLSGSPWCFFGNR